MRLIYFKDSKAIHTIIEDDQSVTSFDNNVYACLQGDAHEVVVMSIAVGLDTGKIITYAEENNIDLNMTPELEKTLKDRAFCHELLNEFNAGEQQTSVDTATYKVVIGVFQYVLFALQMGNVVQAKNQLLEISTVDYAPIWTQSHQDYFINKINTYLGL